MPAGGRGNASEKGKDRGCSPCCAKKDSEESPPLLPAKPLYSGDVMKPTQGTLPSSKAGFLVSFLVDARGGAMTGHRHWGMRVIIPPAAVQQPTRINCRYQQLTSLPFPPPFMERESLASRVIEVTPAGEIFRSPVLIELPHFASNAGAERETIVLRSDDGETWYEHVSDEVENGEIYQDVVTSVVMKDSDLERIYDVLEVTKGRIIRILTSKFPKYFAVLTRVREEVKSVGPDGGKVVLLHEPRLRATFPKNALYKKIKVGLQVQSLKPEIVQAAFGRSVEVSKMIALEPRKRKFHQPIFISIPLPCSPSKITSSTSIRLLCSVTGATEKAAWADLTGSTPLELCKDVVHFSTKVSAIFWLLVIHDKQRDPESALTLASRLYEESILIPYLARFSIFYRENFPRAWVNTIRVYCMTDDKAEKVIKSLQGFRPLAISGDIEVPHTSSIAVKLSGNVIQLKQDPFNGELLAVSSIRTNEVKEPFVFKAFEDNSMTILVQPKDPAQPLRGCLAFGRRLDNISGTQQLPLCELKFDVSGGDTNFVIKEDMMFQTSDLDAGVNEHSPDIIDTAPPMKTFKTIEEEDPYEKVEVKKNKDGLVDINTKISQDVQKQNSVNKKEKQKSSSKAEVTEKGKLKETTIIEQSSTISANKRSENEGEKKTEVNTKSESKSKSSIEKSEKKEEKTKVVKEEGLVNKSRDKEVQEENEISKPKKEKKTEVRITDESKPISNKNQNSKKNEISSKVCIHNIPLAEFCQICYDNLMSLDRRALKETSAKETSDKKAKETEIITEEICNNKSKKKEEKEVRKKNEGDKSELVDKEEKEFRKKNEGDKSELGDKEGKTSNSRKKSGQVSTVTKSCIHDVPLPDPCPPCDDNQRSLSRTRTKSSDEKDKTKTEKISKEMEVESKKVVETVSEDVINSSEVDDKTFSGKEKDDKQKPKKIKGKVVDSKKVEEKLVDSKKVEEKLVDSKKVEEKLLETKKTEGKHEKAVEHEKAEIVESKSKDLLEKSANIAIAIAVGTECIHDIAITKDCKTCDGNQIIDGPKISEETDGKIEKNTKSETVKSEKKIKKDNVKKLNKKEDTNDLTTKDEFHKLDTAEYKKEEVKNDKTKNEEESLPKSKSKDLVEESAKIAIAIATGCEQCIHNIQIADPCNTCDENQVKVGIEKGTHDSARKSTKKSNDTEQANVQKKTESTNDQEQTMENKTEPNNKEQPEIKTTENKETNGSKSMKESTSEQDNIIKEAGKESDVYKKDELKKSVNKKGKSKTQEFKANELEALRIQFAKKQGVKETTLDTKKSETTNKQPDAKIEENSVSPKSPADKDIVPIKEERKKKGGKSKEMKESEPVYEPVGRGKESSPLQNEMSQEIVEENCMEEDIGLIDKSKDKDSGGISSFTDDFKDFSSLKRKKKAQITTSEPLLEDTTIEQVGQSNGNIVETKLQRKDDVIGFDIGITSDDKNPFGAEEEFEEILPIEGSKEINKTNDCESPVKAIPPPLPARRKTSKQMSSSDSGQNLSIASDQKEKKKSFVKEWQKDLKEFFSLGKKKKKDESRSLSRGSSSKRSDTDSRHVDLGKNYKNQDENEISTGGNISKGKIDSRFSSSQESGSLNDQTKSLKEKSPEEGGKLQESEGIYGYTEENGGSNGQTNVDTKTTGKSVSEEKPISNNASIKQDNNTADEAVERRKKKRRDRRKTNSESSFTKVEIPACTVDDEAKVSTNTKFENANCEAQEDCSKQSQKKRQSEKVESMVSESETRMEDTAMKPKIIVPSPQGIPRPKPINKNTNRDSIISDDGDFLQDNIKTGRTGSVEETEEFRKAVESFDQIYLMESGEQSPEIVDSRSSTLSKKKVKSNEDQKPDASPNIAWKKIKTAKSFDASESSSEAMQYSTSQLSQNDKSEMNLIKHQTFEDQESTFFSESKSVEQSQSVQSKKSSKKIKKERNMGTVDDSNGDQSSSVVSENFKEEQSLEVQNKSDIIQSNSVESQSYQSSGAETKHSQSYKSSTTELKQSQSYQSAGAETKQSQQYQLSGAETQQSQSYQSSRTETQQSQSYQSSGAETKHSQSDKSSATETKQSQSYQSSGAERKQSQPYQSSGAEKQQSQSYQSSRAETQQSQSYQSSGEETKQSQSYQSSGAETQQSQSYQSSGAETQQSQSYQSSAAETKQSRKKKEMNIELSDSSESQSVKTENIKRIESLEVQENNCIIQENKVESDQFSKPENNKSSKKNNKNRKSKDVSEKNNNSNQATVSNETKHVIEFQENTQTSNNGQSSQPPKAESKKSSKKNKNKKGKSIDLSDNSNASPASSVKSEVSQHSSEVEHRKSTEKISKHETPWDQTKHDLCTKTNQDNSPEESIPMQSESSRKISILGETYVDTTNNKNANSFSSFEEDFRQEKTSMKKDSTGFFSDEERKELEEENPLVKAIKEFHAQSSTESTHSEVSSRVLSDEEFSNEVQYSELEKQIMQKSRDAQETIKTALQDIDKPKPDSQDKHKTTVTQFSDSRLIDSDKPETIRVQKHSLSIQDGVLIEQTTTEKFSQLPANHDRQIDSCTIDPESLKNVDGQAKQRKGSSRFSKRQGSKSKSPGLGSRNSFSGPDDREEDEGEDSFLPPDVSSSGHSAP